MGYSSLSQSNLCSNLPVEYPAIPLRGWTKEDVELLVQNRSFQQIAAAKELAKELDIPGYVEACSQMQLTINDWLGLYSDPFYEMFGLPELVKEALKITSREINREISKKREEEIGKLKMASMDSNRGLNSNTSGTSQLDRFFK